MSPQPSLTALSTTQSNSARHSSVIHTSASVADSGLPSPVPQLPSRPDLTGERILDHEASSDRPLSSAFHPLRSATDPVLPPVSLDTSPSYPSLQHEQQQRSARPLSAHLSPLSRSEDLPSASHANHERASGADSESRFPPPMTKRWPPQPEHPMFWRNHSPADEIDLPSSAGPSRSRHTTHRSGPPAPLGHFPDQYGHHPMMSDRMPPGPPPPHSAVDHHGPPQSARSYTYNPYEHAPSRSAGYPGGGPMPGGSASSSAPDPQGGGLTRGSPTLGYRDLEFRSLADDDFAQALAVYEHLMAALPHVRPATAPPTHAGAQQYEGLLALASDAVGLLYGENQPLPEHLDRPPSPRNKVLGKRGGQHGPGGSGSGGGGGSERKANVTKCLGCGATETPEWRRGPLGPRTLCNACGLVHMKMLRKQRKEAEKAAIKAAAMGHH